MFLEDELEYVRLKRADNIMGWLAILFVAALVFMFAGLMNSASASGAARPAPAPLVQSVEIDGNPAILNLNSLFDTSRLQPSRSGISEVSMPLHYGLASHYLDPDTITSAEIAAIDPRAARFEQPRTDALADRHIMIGLMLIAFSLMGGSFLMLAFGGPRRIVGIEDETDV